ncbi:PAQR family membrane homeostasis protein TrhA [Pseudobdellovibrio exovorus]|uniref:Hemolysin III n=1 Tax=Pseudobdellovibrio exovorus JSS TaxID=1184267 RepID=M4VC81_9BACT|nr:hemolysin III family protein [Pseudobdellovibrio exovorus]AGH96085.1 hypothetical protein A11Q_1869 [Pseudobdellovibrio exovorus JSS]
MSISSSEVLKPFLRGRFHEAAGFVSLGACLMLIAKCSDARTTLAAIVYSISLVLMFAISGLYHRIQWKPQARQIMRRLDHAAIFGLIAGTSTAVFMLALPPEKSVTPLLLIWGITLVGIVQVLFWIKAPKWLAALIYIAAGWMALPYIKDISRGVGVLGSWLLVIGGVIYTAGALIYAFKKPNPFPKVFGYHEIFHLCVVAAAVVHFIVVYQLIANMA